MFLVSFPTYPEKIFRFRVPVKVTLEDVNNIDVYLNQHNTAQSVGYRNRINKSWLSSILWHYFYLSDLVGDNTR